MQNNCCKRIDFHIHFVYLVEGRVDANQQYVYFLIFLYEYGIDKAGTSFAAYPHHVVFFVLVCFCFL